MPEPQQASGNLTPLTQAYQTSGQGFDSLLGAVQDRIKLRQQTRQMEAEIEQRKDVMTFQMEEQDRIRRSYFHEVELPEQQRRETAQQTQAESEARQQALQDRRQRIGNIEKTVRSSLMTEYSDVLRLPHVSIPVEYTVDEFDRDVVVVPNIPTDPDPEAKTTYESMTLNEYRHYLDSYQPVARFISEYEENQAQLLDRTERIDEGVQRISRSDADALVYRFRTGQATDQDYRDITQGRKILNVPDYTPEVIDRRNRERKVNEEFAAFKYIHNNVFREGLSVDEGGWFGIRRKNYKVDPKTMTVGQMQDVINEARENHTLDSEHPLLQFQQQLIELVSLYGIEGETPGDMSDYMINMNRSDSQSIDQIFIPKGRQTENKETTPRRVSTQRDAVMDFIAPIRF